MATDQRSKQQDHESIPLSYRFYQNSYGNLTLNECCYQLDLTGFASCLCSEMHRLFHWLQNNFQEFKYKCGSCMFTFFCRAGKPSIQDIILLYIILLYFVNLKRKGCRQSSLWLHLELCGLRASISCLKGQFWV